MIYLDLACIKHILTSVQGLTKRTPDPRNVEESTRRQTLATGRPDYAAADETGAVPLGPQ
jgi:hypothetical protein